MIFQQQSGFTKLTDAIQETARKFIGKEERARHTLLCQIRASQPSGRSLPFDPDDAAELGIENLDSRCEPQN